ncbi:MAG: PH domain-containing protein [Candidatus Kapabacteria bacterium]|nr:PH domain-containing protein [Candidatus Kapabacteria bacterium]
MREHNMEQKESTLPEDGLHNTEAIYDQIQSVTDIVSERYRLDSHIVTVWRLHLLLYFVLYAVIAIILLIISKSYITISFGIIACADIIFRFIRAQFVYDNSSFAFGQEDIRFRTGYIFLREVLVPYPRIQHIDIHQGPIERYFNLSSLIIHTAGQSGDSIKIPGLQTEYAEHLRTYLKSFIKSEEEDT